MFDKVADSLKGQVVDTHTESEFVLINSVLISV
jgi:hypothetical protein